MLKRNMVIKLVSVLLGCGMWTWPAFAENGITDDAIRLFKKKGYHLLDESVQIVVPGDQYIEKVPPSISITLSAADKICDEAARNLMMNFRTHLDNRSSYFKDVNYRTALDDWEKSCFRRLDDKTDNILANFVGYLELERVPFCTAFYGPDGNLLTARHCFYDKQYNRPNKYRKNLADVRFQRVMPPYKPIQIVNVKPIGASSNKNYIAHSADMISLVIEEPEQNVPFIFRAPNQQDNIKIIGTNGYMGAGTAESMLVSELSSCYVGKISNNSKCFYHGCNSAPGFSGSPIIVRDKSDKIFVVGMHISAAIDPGQCEGEYSNGVLTEYGNIGISLESVIK